MGRLMINHKVKTWSAAAAPVEKDKEFLESNPFIAAGSFISVLPPVPPSPITCRSSTDWLRTKVGSLVMFRRPKVRKDQK